MTVPPNFSERVYVPSDSLATYEVMGIYIFVTEPSKRLKTHNYLHSEASKLFCIKNIQTIWLFTMTTAVCRLLSASSSYNLIAQSRKINWVRDQARHKPGRTAIEYG